MSAAIHLKAVRRRLFGGLPWSPSTDESRDQVALHFSTEQLETTVLLWRNQLDTS